MDIKVNDEDLKKALRDYIDTKNPEKFISTCGTWAVQFAGRRFRLEEDDLSDLFLIFHESAAHCADCFISRGFINFPSYLTVYVRHLVLGMMRKKREECSTEYLKLWDEDRINRDTEVLVHNEKSAQILKNFSGIRTINRLLLSLRFNMEISENDLYFLEKVLKKQDKSLPEFMAAYNQRVHRKKEEREKIIEQMNFCSRRLYRRDTIINYKKIKRRKMTLANKLDKTHRILTLRELADTLSISRYKAMRMYRQSINKIRNDYSACRAAA